MSEPDLLHILADGEYHSGQGLADRRGVSRTAIWKQVGALSRLGVPIERVRGRGYRVPGGLDLLDARRIDEQLSEAARRELVGLILLRDTDSTNAELERRGIPASGTIACSAEQQTAGRGRRGRRWLSPFASSVYLSIGRSFSGGAGSLEGLSLAVGVAVCETLSRLGVAGLSLKWPNDVLLDGRKLAGILLELSGDLSGSCAAIVGIGVNVALPQQAGAQIDQPWADLHGTGPDAPGRNTLLAALLNHCLPLLAHFERDGFKAWREAWCALDAYADKPVQILQGERRIAGVARGVDERGGLRLETAGGVATFHGGEVSLRPGLE